jgi:hypothetical protein
LVLALLLAFATAAWFGQGHIQTAMDLRQRPVVVEPPRPVRMTLAGVTLIVPRDLVRFDPQKRDSEQPRLDLFLHWPSLEGAGASNRVTLESLNELIFLTITPKDQSVDPPRRLAAIYGRFLESEIRAEAQGLAARRFRLGSGYDGEDLVYDPTRPGSYFVRCAPAAGEAPSSCIRELRMADTFDVVYRFPRAFLSDWRRLEQATRALLSAIGIRDN